jgi:hypothetical protein
MLHIRPLVEEDGQEDFSPLRRAFPFNFCGPQSKIHFAGGACVSAVRRPVFCLRANLAETHISLQQQSAVV